MILVSASPRLAAYSRLSYDIEEATRYTDTNAML